MHANPTAAGYFKRFISGIGKGGLGPLNEKVGGGGVCPPH